MAVDVRDRSQFDAAREHIVETAGSLSVWVNNAGVLFTGPAWEQGTDAHRLMLEVNALGTINGTVSALDHMRGNAGGHVGKIVSLAGPTAVPVAWVVPSPHPPPTGLSLQRTDSL